MKVILLKDVRAVGRRGEVKDVADGYGRNFLIATKSAMLASPENLARQKAWMEEAGRKGQLSKALVEKTIEKVNGKEFEMSVLANDKGVLFAAVGNDKIAELVGIHPDLIDLEHPIKDLGTHEISLDLEKGQMAKFKLRLQSRGS